MNYNFKSIPTVPGAKELIDIILSKTQRKTPTEVHPGYQISRIRKFYMRKVKFAQSAIEEKLEDLLTRFPKLEDIHPFYADLMNVLYDRDHYKLALGHINKAKALCESVAKDYVRMMKYSDSLYRAKALKVAALGRMCTILKKLSNSLSYLEEVRKHLARLPSIDPLTRTLLITGYPNVGKSSFMNNVTRANVEVQPYAFTTKSLSVGHTDYDYVPWQVIDTPGLLDRPLAERNTVEMQAITALAHLHACILYFIDISEECGYSIEQQLALFSSVQSLFINKPIGFVLTKTDVRKYEELSEDNKQMIEAAVQKANAFVATVSNISGEGIPECKRLACERLKEFRSSIKAKHPVVPGTPYISMPQQRDSKARPPVIPPSVLEAKATGMKAPFGPTQKEIQEMKGGAGVYSQPLMEHWELENEDWRYDIAPEMIDGKNIADYIDPDIMQKLEALEKEEEMLADAHVPLDYDELRKSQKLVRRMFLRRRSIHMRSMLMKGHFEPRRKSEAELTEGLSSLGIEPTKVMERIDSRRKRARSEDSGEGMDVDEDEGASLHKKLKTNTEELVQKRTKGAKAAIPSTTIRELKWLKQGKAGVTDKRIPNMMPRHLFSGKRGIGKTERR